MAPPPPARLILLWAEAIPLFTGTHMYRRRGGCDMGHCPYCGAISQADFAFCQACGKRLPPMPEQPFPNDGPPATRGPPNVLVQARLQQQASLVPNPMRWEEARDADTQLRSLTESEMAGLRRAGRGARGGAIAFGIVAFVLSTVQLAPPSDVNGTVMVSVTAFVAGMGCLALAFQGRLARRRAIVVLQTGTVVDARGIGDRTLMQVSATFGSTVVKWTPAKPDQHIARGSTVTLTFTAPELARPGNHRGTILAFNGAPLRKPLPCVVTTVRS